LEVAPSKYIAEFNTCKHTVLEVLGVGEDIGNKISKANGAFNQLQKVWKSSDISLRTELRIFNSNVNSILLYICEP
jgi:hypothetical protein